MVNSLRIVSLIIYHWYAGIEGMDLQKHLRVGSKEAEGDVSPGFTERSPRLPTFFGGMYVMLLTTPPLFHFLRLRL